MPFEATRWLRVIKFNPNKYIDKTNFCPKNFRQKFNKNFFFKFDKFSLKNFRNMFINIPMTNPNQNFLTTKKLF